MRSKVGPRQHLRRHREVWPVEFLTTLSDEVATIPTVLMESADPPAKPVKNRGPQPCKYASAEAKAGTLEELQAIENGRKTANPERGAPSLAEIAAACLQIQSEWTPEERLKRATWSVAPARFPGVEHMAAGDGWRADRTDSEDETTA